MTVALVKEPKTRVVSLRQKGVKYDVYIGRKGRGSPKGADGYFGNPNPKFTAEQYMEYLCERAATDDEFYERLLELRGKVLACWCKPNPCHGDYIALYLEMDADKNAPAKKRVAARR